MQKLFDDMVYYKYINKVHTTMGLILHTKLTLYHPRIFEVQEKNL